MRNLKRALSLLLSSTMVLGMLVMGGSAAGYKDVDDSNVNQEAIEVLQTVGIMTGDQNGNFNPDGSITRNEMAVVMAHLLNLDYDYYRGTNPFTDVPEWAAPYVAACAAEGVVAGIGNGQFGGNQKVTAAQASLMIMKALGYFQNAEDYVDNEQYTEAVAALKQLRDRVTDKDSTMYKSIEELLAKAQSAQADSAFASDLNEAQGYLDDDKLDAASGKLDSLEQDSSLTDEQKKQVEDMKNKLQNARDNAQKQQESEQKKSERKQEFSSEIDELENDDLQISSASNAEDELAMTASSFEQWDELLSEMYDYLSGVLNADQYASEEANYKQWVAERDSGAENAASETDDNTQKQLASYSFKQSYTKARCYKLLDMM